MSTVEEVKDACVNRLTPRERQDVLRWLRGLDDDWDGQIAEDAEAGRLDRLFGEADGDFEAGRCTPL